MNPCYWTIEQLPGLDSQEQALLEKHGITTTQELLQKARTPQEKQTFANQLQINVQYLNKWVALADLARIPSVGYQHCGMLLHSGIASVTQLTTIPIHRLHRQIVRLQVATTQRKDLCPPVELVQKWVQEARSIR